METELTSERRKAAIPANPHRKEIERRYLHSFRCLCSDFPSGDLLEPDPPASDFILVTEAQRKIGIEVTRVFKTGGEAKFSQQSIEATNEEIMVAAKTYSERLNTPLAHVSLFFCLQVPLSANTRREIARRVAQVVHDNMPPEGKSVELKLGIGGLVGRPIAVDLISINRVHPVDRHRWAWHEAGAVQTGAIKPLERKIEEKAQKLDDYLRHCDECWLLIVAPSIKPSGMIHPDQDSLSHTYASPFSRTYFLDFGHRDLVQLNTTAAVL